MSAPSIDSMSVKDLKAELTEYGVDWNALGLVEKSQFRDVLAKTRQARGYPPKKAGADDDESGSDDEPPKASATASTTSRGSSSSSGRGASGSGSRVPPTLRVAVLFDPDNDDMRECANFIQPFFMNTRECSEAGGNVPRVSWIVPASLRAEFIRMKLPEQLSNFDWFTVIFVEEDGRATDFDSNTVSLPKKASDTKYTSPINVFADIALRWDASWIVVRSIGGVLPRNWMTASHIALSGAFASARVAGLVVLDVAWHRSKVLGQNAGIVVPESLDPQAAWYYWLREVYPAALSFELPTPDDAVADADKVLLACDDSAFVAIRNALKKK